MAPRRVVVCKAPQGLLGKVMGAFWCHSNGGYHWEAMHRTVLSSKLSWSLLLFKIVYSQVGGKPVPLSLEARSISYINVKCFPDTELSGNATTGSTGRLS